MLEENKEAINFLLKEEEFFKGLYTGNDNYGKPKIEYIKKVILMSDDELYKVTKDMIWLSAYASNNPRSDYHWQCDLSFDEWKRREKSEMYSKAHKEVSNDF